MSQTATPLDPANPDFGAEVTGIDIANGVSHADAQGIEQAIDRYGVLVFRDQVVNDEQQFAFSRNFGPMEMATGDVTAHSDRRLSMKVNDISNLDKDGQVLPRDDRARLFGLGNICLLYTSPSPRDKRQSRMPSSA